jgi:hypothetical protein
LTLGRAALAQNVVKTIEALYSDRPEACAVIYFASVTRMAGSGGPQSRKPGSLKGGIEMNWIPTLSKSQRRVGFNGLKDSNKALILIRPHLSLGLPGRVVVTVSYLSSIEIFELEPRLFVTSLERPLYEREPWTFRATVRTVR